MFQRVQAVIGDISDELKAGCIKLMEQVAQWDALEETWEVFVPTPSTASIELGNAININNTLDLSLAVDDLFDENGLTYENAVIDGNKLTLLGIRLS